MAGFLLAFAFVLGLVVGSFLNVCILRIPAGESIVRPASHCPKCNKPIAPYDNIPLLSWIWLRGKCRHCRAPISPLYPAVELLTGLLFAACAFAFGYTFAALKWAIFSSLLVVLAITDYRVRILPDKVNLTGALLGLACSSVLPVGDGTALWLAGIMFPYPPPAWVLSIGDALLGAVAGAGVLWIFLAVWPLVVGYEGMGLGDVKMMAMVGTFFGTKAAVFTIMVASLLGSVLGLLWIAILYSSTKTRKIAERAHRRNLGSVRSLRLRLAQHYWLPFGTFLAGAALLVIFYGPPVLSWYFGRLQ